MINDLQEFRIDLPQNMNMEKVKHDWPFRKILIGLAIIIIIESFWAVSYLKSSKNIKLPLITNNGIFPKEKIASMSLITETNTVAVGQPIEIKINIDTNNRTVNGVDAVVRYDPLMFDVSDSVTGDLYQTLLINDVDTATGTITLTGSRISSSQDPIKGTGTLAKITLLPKQVGSSEIKIMFDPEKSDESNVTETKTSKNILTHTTNAQISITQ